MLVRSLHRPHQSPTAGAVWRAGPLSTETTESLGDRNIIRSLFHIFNRNSLSCVPQDKSADLLTIGKIPLACGNMEKRP